MITIIHAFDVPTEGVRIPMENARVNLHRTLQTELQSIMVAVDVVGQALLPFYTHQIERFGGIPVPSTEEARRAREILDYFKGGERPSWMDGEPNKYVS